MKDYALLSLQELAERIGTGKVTVEAVAHAAIERITELEPEIRAWQHFDPAQVLRQARRLDTMPANGVLHGLPVGVKDLMDTADMPTTYGSPIYVDHHPEVDAACVGATRHAGALLVGKTVTTEFATFHAGPTRNPRAALPHTPGGSSSGSAAAVACGMVPVAFGTQTAGSIVRPAAFCGVVGYKPTYGTLPLAGIKSLAISLDTVGVLTRSVTDAAFFIGALAQLPLSSALATNDVKGLKVGIVRTPHWDRAGASTRAAMTLAAQLLETSGAVLRDVELPSPCNALSEAQITIMAYEAAAAFAPERASQSDGFSKSFANLMEEGSRIGGQRYVEAQALAATARAKLVQVFESVDLLLAPSTEGEAPAGLSTTGDPIFNRMWTLLGNPCVHVPLGNGSQGLPIGVTLVGPRWGDDRVLTAAARLERAYAGTS
ncbi:MAG: amidase [Oxalicibacterium faecigallinarum]|uniref:amidase n=1 Tax=Oxalicibacterium faecigallinarum TaxID=573741 RepID=UPI0028087288|nr:amidase [Oxalicibacterium faecigallinarum]MDQ7969757.1 amidase [Oxalicibacterium faecigallinarum]